VCIPSMPSTSQVWGLHRDQDSDDSLSSASEVANKDIGMRYNVPDEHSECSDESTNMSNDMHESGMCSDNHSEMSSDVDDEPDGSDSALVMSKPTNNDMRSSGDVVEFRCIQVYHHMSVDDEEEEEDEGSDKEEYDDSESSYK
jgi:hypothetical protein